MKKAAFHTLGCKVNAVETEQLIEAFMLKGYEIVPFKEAADVYVINTCTVTHVSDRKSRAMIRRAVKRRPEAIVAAIGCLAQTDCQQLASIEGIDIIVGNRDKDRLADIIEMYGINKTKPVIHVSAIKSGDLLPTVIYRQRHDKTRAFIKIQDGCQSYCTYCIVPYARGPVRSKNPDQVIEEILQLTALGYKEIVLTGIHTGAYGTDLKDHDLASLLLLILEQIKGDYRIRLGSLEPLEINPRLLEVMASSRQICRHLHIPLQSGSNRILGLMNRRYSREYYRDLVLAVADKIPGVAIAADVMVGFPDEKEADFIATRDLLAELPVSSLHVFKYSVRPGTKAAMMGPAIEERVKNQRSEILLDLAAAKKHEFCQSMLGQNTEALVQQQLDTGIYEGLTDNYLEIQFPAPEDLTGNLIRVKPQKIEGGVMKGIMTA
ncbi:MAG: tRNA (N(6)-L-threonylcarbamoyladenosine(37)-C(2))-methylthiotransferase MtaB [Syntrophomonadaceae bacterium]|nr:tRNA (N(6)-L-threonylcarbamoyladenosine(37)-C(2))-methylthiotransferase MtaB [Syntrophomonadaceae bacterium]